MLLERSHRLIDARSEVLTKQIRRNIGLTGWLVAGSEGRGPDERRYIVNIRTGVEVGTQWQRDFVFVDELGDEALLVVQVTEVHPARWAALRAYGSVLVVHPARAEVAHLVGARLEVLHRNLVGTFCCAQAAFVARTRIDQDDPVLLALVQRVFVPVPLAGRQAATPRKVSLADGD